MRLMIIRVLSPADVLAYRALRLEALTLEPAAYTSSAEDFEKESLESIKARLENKEFGNFIMGAFEGERLIGIASFVPETRVKVEHKGNVFGVYVTASERGKGIAKKIMQDLLRHVRTYPNIKQINIAVITSQVAAKNLYTSLGFKVWGLERNALKLGETFYDEEWMVLRIPRT
jgi:RimJ/RimL family protein N-acetyltransferase